MYAKNPGGPNSWAVFADGDIVANHKFVYAQDFITQSDRNTKENFAPVEPTQILQRVVSIPIQTWNFQNEPTTRRHLGPMAQDFHAAFELSTDDTHISALDANGVALAAIQGLYAKLHEKDRQLEELQLRVRQLEQQARAR